MPLTLWFRYVVPGAPPEPPIVAGIYPEFVYQVAFDDVPLEPNPAWSDLSSRLRAVDTKRGRSYEFDRIETGTSKATLNNRDAALSPENTASTYYPLLSTRQVRSSLRWELIDYPLFHGISEGFPQTYPALGKDAIVEYQANDFFYALNNARFSTGLTTLASALAVVSASTEEFAFVASTALPMPQVAPFTIKVASGPTAQEEGSELIEVLEIFNATTYRVRRGSAPNTHPVGAAITTEVVSFGEETSGTRIQNVLEAVGFTSAWWDLDTGLSVMAPSDDLASTNPLEHISLIAEAEFGRFFVGKDGRFTFRDRNSVTTSSLTPAFTFVYAWTGAATEMPYRIEGALEDSEDKLINRVKITIPSGEVVDLKDEASIEQHFERIFEREWPYANVNDADSAARYILARSAERTLRLPSIAVFGAKKPSTLWPLLLNREIGDRARFRYQPEGGGDEIDKEVIIDGISHAVKPKEHVVRFQCTEADPNAYWILGVAGYSELGETTIVGF